MRIAVVHSYYSSARPSGENIVVDDQIAQLRAAGHDVHVVARRTDDLEGSRGYRLSAARTTATGWGPSPDEELQAIAPDVVHVHNTFPNFGTRWLDRWGSRTIATVHNYRTVCAAGILFRDGHECRDCLRSPVLPALRHRCYRDSLIATAPVAVGNAPRGALKRLLTRPALVLTLNDDLARVLGEASGRVLEVVPNFARHLPSSESTLDAYAYVGRLGAEKGIRELLAMWPQDRRLVVYGDGDLGDELRGEHSSRNGIEFRGNIPHEQLLGELGSYRGVVVPSMWAEGLPTVLIEALSLGVPSLVSDHVSAGAFLERRGVCIRIRTADHGLVNLDASLDAVERGGAAMRQRCRSLHRERYSPEAWIRSMEPLYERVASGSH